MPSSEPTRSDAPFASVTLVKNKAADGEVIRIGPVRIDVLEDGRNTDQRLGAVLITLPPKAAGPPEHWHQMHDETFLVLKGKAAFYSRGEKMIADEGDYLVVPPHSPHTFGNASDTEETVIYNTFTPAYYVNYFRLMAKMMAESPDGKLTPELALEAMSRYATITTKGPGIGQQH